MINKSSPDLHLESCIRSWQ